jgi:sortase B
MPSHKAEQKPLHKAPKKAQKKPSNKVEQKPSQKTEQKLSNKSQYTPSHQIQRNKTEPNKRDFVSRLVLILGILLLLAALVIGGFLAWGYLNAQSRYREIQSVAGLEIGFGEVVKHDLALEDLYFDWDALRAANADIVAWIIIPGTQINYPVVQGADNEYYLYHLFDASSSGTGAIFSDYQGSKTLDAQNNVLYGHNMLDGSMFSDILKYTNQDYFNEHMVVYLGTPSQNYELEALATIKIDQNAPLRIFDFATEEDFKSFIDSTLATTVTASASLDAVKAEPKNLYSLVTCDSFNDSQRIVLNCIPVKSVIQTAPQ